jgi:hypothetical protein
MAAAINAIFLNLFIPQLLESRRARWRCHAVGFGFDSERFQFERTDEHFYTPEVLAG